MKLLGQSPLISHSLVVGFSLILILVVIMTLSHLENEYQTFTGNSEIQEVCGIIKYSTEKIYNPTNYTSPTNSTMGRIVLTLPERIAGISYRARFSDNLVYVNTVSEPLINTTCSIDINATFSGTTNGGETLIIWKTYTNKKDEIIMEVVNI